MPKFILGAGITGLTVAKTTGLPVYEAGDVPGGICSSYYVRPKSNERLKQIPGDEEAYRFEIGGGHWIFGANNEVLKFIGKFAKLKSYIRRSSVYFVKKNLYVPYPIQNNLRFLDREIAEKILKELSAHSKDIPCTMKEWLVRNFGQTLCNLFFYPFHDLYTAYLYGKIAPQDGYKTPVDPELVAQGAKDSTPSVGYNTTFVYPQQGLNIFLQRVASKCDINYKKQVAKIDVDKKNIYFSDGCVISYGTLISTLPLNKVIEMAGIKVDVEPDPYTSVLALNIGAVRGANCPGEHWLYVPNSKSGFHRVGFYSNVDSSFLPKSSRQSANCVSLYVEKTYEGGHKPSGQDIKTYTESVIRELKEWGFIKNTEVADATWIDVAYTWSWPGSKWREKALELLKKHDIHQLGHYGQWRFQGIAESIKAGLNLNKEFERNCI